MTLLENESFILRAIKENKEFRKKFGEKAVSILDKVYSYYSNPNCQCKDAIINWIKNNENVTNELINNFKELFEQLKNTQTVPVVSNTTVKNPVTTPTVTVPNMKIGEIFRIERTSEAYKQFHEKVRNEKWVFRGISVVPEVYEGKEVWTIFTY